MLQHQKPGFRGFRLVFTLIGIAACSDGGSGTTPPPPPPPAAAITLTGLPAPGATLHQVALAFTVIPDSASHDGLFKLAIDSAPPAAVIGDSYSGTFMVFSAPLTNGVHTAHLVIVAPPFGGATRLDTTFSFTVDVDSKPYLTTVLPPLPGSTDALADDMNSSGVIVGTSLTTNIIGHAVTWTNGVVAQLPTPGGLLAAASAINSQGDIVGVLYWNGAPYFSAALWVPGDTLQLLGDLQTAIRINDKGQVLLSTPGLYDIGSKSTTSLWTNVVAADMNSSGEALGFQWGAWGPINVFVTSGLSLPTIHPLVYDTSKPVYHPVDLNDKGDILLDDNGWWVLGQGSAAEFLNGPIGAPPIDPTFGGRVNNKSQVVGLSNGVLYLWDNATQRTQRVDAGGNWTFNRISYFGDDGKILVHGTDTQTGTTAALLLTPQ